MIQYFINGDDRSGDVEANTLRINNQIGQRTNNCAFRVFQGDKPIENQDVKIYASAEVESVSGNVLTLVESYQTGVLRFYIGQQIHVRIGEDDEAVATVTDYDETTHELTITGAQDSSGYLLQEDGGKLLQEDGFGILIEGYGTDVDVHAGDTVGPILFGGVVGHVEDENIGTIDVLEWNVQGVDYTKIFDKKLISDTWEDRDSRYIINDFMHTTVNYGQTIDDLNYADNAAIRAEWIEASDGGNPSVNTTDPMEGDASGSFPWTFSGGTALWEATPTQRDLSTFTGVSTGTPTAGELMVWGKSSDLANVTRLYLRVGSSALNHARVELTFTATNDDWQFLMGKMVDADITGTPDWVNADYVALEIVQTGSGTILLNGIRLNQTGSFTMFNVTSSQMFDDLRSPGMKPTALMNLLAKTWEYVWRVDYEKDIHFATKEAEPSPWGIDDDGDNYDNLRIDVDATQIGNRVLVRGGEKLSASRYSQVFQGDGVLREWVLKSKFSDIEVTIDNGTSTHAAAAGTNTTNIKIVAHGLSTGDHVINRTRSAVRQITVVDVDNFTVDTVASQTNGDNITFFASVQTVGIEGITDESTVEYVSNSNEKSVRSTSIETTITSTSYIRMEYNERVPIQLQYTDAASADAMKMLGFGDGVFDLDPITDRNIKDTNTALAIAQARVKEFANAVITGNFTTDQEGLKAGQIFSIVESVRGIATQYVIQKVSMRSRGGEFKDYFDIDVTFGTTLFGWIEFMQKLLAMKDKIELNTDDIVETFVTTDEEVDLAIVESAAKGGFKSATQAEIIETVSTNLVQDFTPPWHWETSSGQPLATRWNLFEWS